MAQKNKTERILDEIVKNELAGGDVRTPTQSSCQLHPAVWRTLQRMEDFRGRDMDRGRGNLTSVSGTGHRKREKREHTVGKPMGSLGRSPRDPRFYPDNIPNKNKEKAWVLVPPYLVHTATSRSPRPQSTKLCSQKSLQNSFCSAINSGNSESPADIEALILLLEMGKKGREKRPLQETRNISPFIQTWCG